jgi:hypothetical protein
MFAYEALMIGASYSAHFTLVTNSLFLAKVIKTEECTQHNEDENLNEAWISILHVSDFHLVHLFFDIKFTSIALYAWCLILIQFAYALVYSVPIACSNYDLDMKDRDLKGRFLTYSVLGSKQYHHDNALLVLAESGRMDGIKFQASQYLEECSKNSLFYAGQLYADMLRALMRALLFLVFDVSIQINLQVTFVALSKRISGGNVDGQTVASLMLGIFAAIRSFTMIWNEVNSLYTAILTAPIWSGRQENDIVKRLYDIDARHRARRLRFVLRLFAVLFFTYICYAMVKLMMITMVCQYGWNLDLKGESGCVLMEKSREHHQYNNPLMEVLGFCGFALFGFGLIVLGTFLLDRLGLITRFAGLGTLIYPVHPEDEDRAKEAIEDVGNGIAICDALAKQLPGWTPLRKQSSRRSDKNLMFVFTDAEPDDLMAIAQLWQFKRATESMKDQPVVVLLRDTSDKDQGQIADKKMLLFAQMVGFDECHVLTPETKEISSEARQTTLRAIADELAAFTGDVIDFYLMSPGRGNLRAITDSLKVLGPLKHKWRILLYSGSFNMQGMSDGDIEALKELMVTSDRPLVDLAKFPFFGGDDSHNVTQSFTTFALPDFAMDLGLQWPLLAATLQSFNAEFNARLIAPRMDKIFTRKLDDEERDRFETNIASKYDEKNPQPYAEALVSDVELWNVVKKFKKGTLTAFAFGGCDSPLCDQLIFLYLWLKTNMPDDIEEKVGKWNLNKVKGFTEIKDD